MLKAFEGFGEYLRSKHLKLTLGRKLVLQEILLYPGHLEAEDLWHILRNKKKRVSRATVYRTLGLLINSGIIRKVDFGHGHSHYERVLAGNYHEHMICLKCGKVIEFSDKSIEHFLRKLCEKDRFTSSTHCLQIFGYCKNCR